ncbi:MAG: molybdate ABC transporter substrate-binding protein [Henriciella sp.]
MIKPRIFLTFLLAVLIVSLGSCSAPQPQEHATVAVATNFKTTLEKLEADFETRSGYMLDVVSGSTGKLYAQINNGAPYDLFLSADQARPERLVEDGRAVQNSRFTYAIGGLALWSPTRPDITPDTLADNDITRLALANPDLAPYGLATVQLLERLDLLEPWQAKFVLGENVGQAFAFVSTGNAEIGFVSAAQVLALPEDARGSYWLVPRQLHEPIAQDAVLLKTGEDNQVARAFLTFLKTPEARDIIHESGYRVP